MASQDGKSSPQPGAIDLNTLDPQQLQNLRDALNNELEALKNSFSALQEALNGYGQSLEALNNLEEKDDEEKDDGADIMVPLAGSMYIPGNIKHIKTVLVDIGTGYFARKTIPDAQNFMQRKLGMVQANLRGLANTINQKQESLNRVDVFLQSKIQALQQQQQQQAEAAAADS
eukprot:g12074.t1